MFLKNLESLRGIAALMVALCHCLLVLTVDGMDNIWFTTFSELGGAQATLTRFLLLFFNGGAAVIVFFVLSGYVLGLSLDKHALTIRRTLGFYTKRLFRLYPAHIVVLAGIVLAMVALFEYRTFDAASAWYALWYHEELSAARVFRNAVLYNVDLNHIAWSLQVELAGSLFLPLFYLVARRLHLGLNLVVFAALVWLSWWSSNLYLIFLHCFYGGLVLPQVQGQFKHAFCGRSGNALLVLGGLALFAGYTLAGPQSLFGRVLIETIGGMLVIGWLINPDNDGRAFNRFLSRGVINRLGKYSYSFYLLHFVILYGVSYALMSAAPAEVLLALPLLFGIALMAVTVPLTYWLAGLVYHKVEVPMIRAGKRLVGN
ncbi:MAG: acyltransferase [Xanthomonadales bacterium]|nr:acyltransferase [Xanthomonadales bacterium]